jgi:hypothetical protein
MKHIASCETFQRARKTTQPAFPTLPEQRVSNSDILLLLETIDDILAEFNSPPRVT